MQTQTIKTELSINGTKVTIGHQFLEDISRDIPDTKENIAIFDILATSDNYEVRENIASNNNLSKKAIKLLINDENQDVVNNILSNSESAKLISQKSIMKIINNGNIEHISTIANNLEYYTKCDSCKIVEILSRHKNPLVRFKLFAWRSNDIIPTNIVKKLTLDEDFDVAKEAKEEFENRMK